MHKTFNRIVAAVVLTVALIGCGPEEMGSTWRDREVVIDGADSGGEWDNARHTFVNEEITLGVLNDADNLYLRLSTRNPAVQKQLSAMGFYVWFDESGGSEKRYGIHIPVPAQPGVGVPAGRPQRPPKDAEVKPVEAPRVFPTKSQEEVGIFQPDSRAFFTVPTAHAALHGLQYRTGSQKGNLICEMRIPLRRSSSRLYGIGTLQTKSLGICLEIEEAPMERGAVVSGSRAGDGQKRRSGESQSAASEFPVATSTGPGDSTGGGPIGNMGGGVRDGRTGSPTGLVLSDAGKSIQLWLKVHLAAKP